MRRRGFITRLSAAILAAPTIVKTTLPEPEVIDSVELFDKLVESAPKSLKPRITKGCTWDPQGPIGISKIRFGTADNIEYNGKEIISLDNWQTFDEITFEE